MGEEPVVLPDLSECVELFHDQRNQWLVESIILFCNTVFNDKKTHHSPNEMGLILYLDFLD